jgi:hypothetical protein
MWNSAYTTGVVVTVNSRADLRSTKPQWTFVTTYNARQAVRVGRQVQGRRSEGPSEGEVQQSLQAFLGYPRFSRRRFSRFLNHTRSRQRS